jgi:rubrerythrin
METMCPSCVEEAESKMTFDNPGNLLTSKDVEHVLMPNNYICPKCGGVLLVMNTWATCRHCKKYSIHFENK